MNPTFQRKKSIQANDLIHEQFLVLGKLDNKKHSSIILKGFDKINKTFVVIKITSAAYREKNKNVTKILQKLRGGIGVPNIIWRGMEAANTVTVTECLGPNLKKLFFLMDKNLSIATISMIAIQALNTLESIHSYDYVCCNIMPKEVLISLHKRSLTLFITDYKQARKVKNAKLNTNDVSHTANKAILNKFSSVNLHLGLPASKKDDVESLGYILVYFFKKGNLFDKDKFSSKEEKIKYYEQQKLSLIPETFCNGLPNEMGLFMSYIKTMQTQQLSEKIDYDYLRKLFRNLFNKHGSTDNFQYDWISKARTYNFDPNAGQKLPDGVSDGGLKSEIMTFQSSKMPDSEVFPESSEHGHHNSIHLVPFSLGQHYEYDFFGIDEFIDSPAKSADSKKVHKIGFFMEKVKSLHDITSNSSTSCSPIRDRSSQDHCNSDREHETSKTEKTITVFSSSEKDEEIPRTKIKSATQVRKVSRFGELGNKGKSS